MTPAEDDSQEAEVPTAAGMDAREWVYCSSVYSCPPTCCCITDTTVETRIKKAQIILHTLTTLRWDGNGL